MKFLIQRVTSASVTVFGEVIGKIDKGFFVLIGVTESDTRETADKLIRKLMGLRIFADAEGKTNLSISDVGGSLLLVSQFTLYADCKKGNRPSFIKSGSPQHAEEIYDYIVDSCRQLTAGTDIKVEIGSFGADMTCSIVSDGPFTIDLDSEEL